MLQQSDKEVVVIGAGPAGLTAAWELSKTGVESIILEKDTIVGGLSRTTNYKGFLFDIGGHRFFTKVRAVEEMWREILQDGDFLKRSRLSRIYYNKKFFYYPLRASNALLGLGLWNSFLILMSYIWAQLFPEKPEETFEQWVSNRFGRRLYRIFFKTYTEKVWGIPCHEISAEWAAQRIKGLSLLTALKNALIKAKTKDKRSVIKTLIDTFDYPRQGPGMMWETVAHLVQERGSQIRLGATVEKILWKDHQVDTIEIKVNGQKEWVKGNHFISSMPIRELIEKFDPAVPDKVLQAAKDLSYRDFLTVALIVDKKELFPDNWIYIHDPSVKVGRIQNFKNWSPDMVPDPTKTCLGLEYFCFEGDGLWTTLDDDLIELGKKELEILRLAKASDIVDGTVVRMPKAYPVYDSTYRESLGVIRRFLERIDNLQLIGRNGMHKYNNQDHSMLTAMLAVKNILGGQYDLWQVNADQEYHEEITTSGEQLAREYALLGSTQPRVPVPVLGQPSNRPLVGSLSTTEVAIMRAFSRMDKLAFATAMGSVSGLAIFIATLVLIIKGGNVVGPNLQLLSQYFIGYTVTIKGAFIGMVYSSFWGFLSGWLFAYLRNFCLGFFVYVVRKKSELLSLEDFFDHF